MSTQALALRHGKLERRIFFAAVDALPPEEFLSEGEKSQYAGYRFATKQESFLFGRLAAKRALGALLDEPDLRRIAIRPGIYGQPIVEHPRAAAAGVSVSHSQGLAVALAFPAAYPMGIDLETVAAGAAGTILGELQASPAERAWLDTAGVAPSITGLDTATACYVLWTAREALGKALKIGINSPLGILALADIQASGARTWTSRYLNFPRCRCLSQAKGGHVLSLALPGEVELGSRPRLP